MHTRKAQLTIQLSASIKNEFFLLNLYETIRGERKMPQTCDEIIAFTIVFNECYTFQFHFFFLFRDNKSYDLVDGDKSIFYTVSKTLDNKKIVIIIIIKKTKNSLFFIFCIRCVNLQICQRYVQTILPSPLHGYRLIMESDTE